MARKLTALLLVCLLSTLLVPVMPTALAAAGFQVAPVPTAVQQGLGQDLGPASASQPLTLVVGLRLPHQGAMHAAAAAVHAGAAAPMTPAAFTAAYAPSAAAYAQVVSFLTQAGFQVQSSPDRLIATAIGTVGEADAAFGTRIDTYALGGRTAYANVTPATVPAALAGEVQAVLGLDSLSPFQVAGQGRPAVVPPVTVAQSVYYFQGSAFTPLGIQTAYDMTPVYQTVYGTGSTIDIVIANAVDPSDIATFDQTFGLPSFPLNQIAAEGGTVPVNFSVGSDEATLDVEWSHAMAPGATIDVYESPDLSNPDLVQALDEAVSQHQSNVISMSWGAPEAFSPPAVLDVADSIFAEGAAEGITFLAAAGDAGAQDQVNNGVTTPIVEFPASDPYVTAVGGTYLTPTANGAYGGETTWNSLEGYDDYTRLGLTNEPTSSGGGGGFSTVFPAPPWQAAANVTNWQADGHVYNPAGMRGVPDVSLNSGNMMLKVVGGQLSGSEGTSFATPIWAGFVDLVDQALTLQNRPPLGDLAPVIYGLHAADPTLFYGASDALFHDVTVGTNDVVDTAPPYYYPAAPGWDPATGWGSPDFANLFAVLTAITSISSVALQPVAVPSGYAAGTSVTIVGTSTHFGAGAQVVVTGGSPPQAYTLTPQIESPTQITVTLPAGLNAGSYEVMVQDATDGTLSATLDVGSVTAVVSPASVPAGYGPTTLTVTASGLPTAALGGFGPGSATTVQAVYAGGGAAGFTPATGVLDAASVSAVGNEATFTLPSGLPAGSYDLVVNDQSDGLNFFLPFTVSTAAPTVTGLSPAGGPAAGGTVVTITGTGFTPGSTVKFGSTPATSVTVAGGTSMTATSPPGSGTVDVTVTSANGTSSASSADRFTYGLRMLTAATLPPATVGRAYTAQLAATGGTAPYTWSLASGSLPAGLSLDDATGVISGTPTAAGTATFTVQAADSTAPTPDTATESLSLTVTAGILSITTQSLPSGTAGASYTTQLAAAGGAAPYVWSVVGGSLPPGLSLSASGTISGAPAAPGQSSMTVEVTDATTPAQVATESLDVTVAPLSLSVATAALPPGMAGRLYTATLVAAGGTPPYAWSLASGSTLPAGLTLNTVTGAVYGTPQAAGTTPLTVEVSDAASHTASASLSLAAAPAGLVMATQSLPGATDGTAYSAQLEAAGGSAPYSWSLVSGALPAGLTLNTVTGSVYGTPRTLGPSIFTVQVSDGAATADGTLGLLVTNTGAATGSSAGADMAGGEGTATPDTVATASGTGSLAVAAYSGNPTAPATFQAAGTYFDAAVESGSSFSQVTLQQCGMSAGQLVYWYDSGTDQWSPVTPQSLNTASGCATLGPLTTTTSPTLAQLTGTTFGVADAAATLEVGTSLPSYAAGDTVVVGGILANATAPVSLTVTDPQGDTVLTGTLSVNAQGAFAAQVPTPSDAPLGTYTVSAVASPASGQLNATSTFDVTPPVVVASVSTGSSAPAVPAVLSLSPAGGPASGGTSVTIAGDALLGATAVHFGQAAAASFVVQSNTEIVAVSPAGTGSVDVTVTTPTGVSAASPSDRFTYTAPAPTVTFSDVPATSWAYPSIQALVARGIVNGFPDGTFQPDAAVSRAQFVKMLVLALGLKTGGGLQTPFADVAAGDWFAPYVAAAVQAGIVQGLTPTTFGPNAPLTREDMAVLLTRALRLSKTAPLQFTDDADIAPAAVTGVEAAVAAGYMDGFPDGSFQPRAAATRAQAAKVLALVLQGQG